MKENLKNLIKKENEMTRLLAMTIAVAAVAAVADEPHWIGLDTTARRVVKPAEQTALGTFAITPLWSRVASKGRTIRGYRAPGALIIVR